MRSPSATVLAVLAALVPARAASAGDQDDDEADALMLPAGHVRPHGGVVVESYTGGRPDDADAVLGPVLAELTTLGWAVGYREVGARLELASRPGRSAAGLPGDFIEAIDRGHRAWVRGRFDDAVAALGPLLEAARANPAAVTRDQRLRGAILRGLIDLALCQQRLGHAEPAQDAMGEVLRSFPDAIVSRAAYGPEAFDLYQATRKALASGERGVLIVESTNPHTVIFVNERFERVGSVHKPDLVPGRYRVYSVVGDREGRVFDVAVRAGGETRLAIDASFDQALRVGPAWVGFAFPGAPDRERFEGLYAARLGALSRATAVAVIGIDEVRGRTAVVGSLVALDSGRPLLRASVPLEREPTEARLRSLARFLDGGVAGAGLDVAIGPSRVRVLGSARRWGRWKYAAAGGAVVTGVAAGYLLAVDGDCIDPSPDPGQMCMNVRNTIVVGGLAAAASAGALAVAIYMLATDRPVAERPRAAILPRPGGALAVVSLSF